MNVIMHGIAKDFFIHGSIIAKKSLFCDLELMEAVKIRKI